MKIQAKTVSDKAATPIAAVVINLARHRHRLEWFMNNARRIDLDVERIDAIDGNDETAYAQIEGIRCRDSGLSNAETACILSHRKAWKKLLESSQPFLAIFEDDAHLSEDMRHLLASNLLSSGLDLIKLEIPSGRVSFSRKVHAPFLGRNLHRLLSRAYGAGGYIVSRKCAQRLLEVSEVCDEPVDVLLFDDKSVIWQEFPVLQVVPAACVQDVILSRMNCSEERFESAIESERKHAKFLRKTRNLKTGKTVAFRKIRRYFSCVLNGANPFKYREHVPLDLGFPSSSDQP